MRVVGSATKEQLLELKRRGMTPQQAVNALTDEAKLRHPNAGTIVVMKNGDGFDIVAI